MSDPLRIGLVHPFCWPEVRRGGERYLDDLGRSLARLGHEVEVLTGTAGRSRVERIDTGPGSLTIRRFHQRPIARLEARGVRAVELFGAVVLPRLVRHRYDVVHALTPTGALAARAAGQRVVYSMIGHAEPEVAAAHPWLRRIGTAAVRTAPVAAALSEASVAGWAPIVGRTAVPLPPGVVTAAFTPRLSPRVGPPIVLFGADASVRRKGVDRLFDAFERVLDERPDARLQLSSPGDWRWALPDPTARPRLAAAIDDLGVGAPGDLPGRYRDATVTVLPSTGEAFGLVLVESLASGTPVVCNDDGGMPEIVRDPGVGRVADAADPAALARAILDVIDLAADPATPARCAEHARRWDWDESVGPAHVAVYERVARRRRGPVDPGG